MGVALSFRALDLKSGRKDAYMEQKPWAKGVRYQRHCPEQTLLYQIVERYCPELSELMARQGKRLPKYIEQEFEDFLKCGRLECGFLINGVRYELK